MRKEEERRKKLMRKWEKRGGEREDER